MAREGREGKKSQKSARAAELCDHGDSSHRHTGAPHSSTDHYCRLDTASNQDENERENWRWKDQKVDEMKKKKRRGKPEYKSKFTEDK